jgi:hypothetical protein
MTATLSPSEIAKRYACDTHKVLGWIRRGELRALNVATTAGGRPRWRITEEALAVFEASRAVAPLPRLTRSRRKKNAEYREYF